MGSTVQASRDRFGRALRGRSGPVAGVVLQILAFPNGLMWLMSEDAKELVIPDIDGVANFWASHNAWGIAVLHDADGPVHVTVSSDPLEDPALALLHEGVLRSDRQLIEVQTVYMDLVASFPTESANARISCGAMIHDNKNAFTSSAPT